MRGEEKRREEKRRIEEERREEDKRVFWALLGKWVGSAKHVGANRISLLLFIAAVVTSP